MAISNETILQVKTPAYIFDLEALRERVRMMRAQLGDKIRLVYAVKANPFLVRALIPLVDAFEICSPGEEVICRRAGVPGRMMVLSGVNKERENFSQIMDRYGEAPVYTAESEQQLRLLSDLAVEKALTIRVFPRLCGGSQFGMDEQVLRDAAAHMERYPGLVFAGVHFFTGTQKKPKVTAREITRVDALLCELRQTQEQSAQAKEQPAQDKTSVLSGDDRAEGCAGSKSETDEGSVRYREDQEGCAGKKKETGVCSVRCREDQKGPARTDTDQGMLWQELEFGPGLAVRYFTGDVPPDDEATLADLRAQLTAMRFDGRVTLEMGRFIAAYCGYYVTRVEDMKTNDGTRYCIVDGGIHQVNYYGSNMGMKIPFTRQLRAPQLTTEDTRCPDDLSQNTEISGPAELQPWTVCGSLCTTADVIVRELPLTDLQIHDILVFERTGAYSVTEGVSLFLSRDLPRVYLWEEDGLQLVRDRILTEVFNDGTAD